jgi:GNAT superfamily N-acetyltransferase
VWNSPTHYSQVRRRTPSVDRERIRQYEEKNARARLLGIDTWRNKYDLLAPFGELVSNDRLGPIMLKVRLAISEDSALICTLIRELGEYERLSHEVVSTEERLKQTLFGPRPYAEALIAEWSGEPAGFALFFHNYSTFLAQPGIYLEDLFVRPWARNKGIGRELLARVARIGVERGCGRMEWAVLDWNEPAISFYRKRGAIPMNEWTIFRLTGTALREMGRATGE